jgi:hypothetical protein
VTKLRTVWATVKALGETSIPIYVTRKAGDGMIGSWSVSGLAAIAFILLLGLNILLWGVAGIIVALGVIF